MGSRGGGGETDEVKTVLSSTQIFFYLDKAQAKWQQH